MDAMAKTVEDIITNSKLQFIVPLFQRTYSWGSSEWEKLWDDICSLIDENDDEIEHFFGSIVIIKIDKSSPYRYLLIDGQQRLTTIFILLALIRNLFQNNEIAQDIYDYTLINKGYENTTNYYRLQPTQKDRNAFQSLIQKDKKSVEFKETELLVECYYFFKKKLEKEQKREKNLLKIVKDIILKKFKLVRIELNSKENPYLIFESLNARGVPLTQADLIRNHIFMEISNKEISTEQQENLYKKDWYPMQEGLGNNLTEFIRHYLSAEKKCHIRQNDVFIKFKEFIDNSENKDILYHLTQLHNFSIYYQKILNPISESNEFLRKALLRIKKLRVTILYPFLLKCYHAFTCNKLDEKSFCQILSVVENYIIRRFICDIPTHGLNKVFPAIYPQVENYISSNSLNYTSGFVLGLINILQNRKYPNDLEFKEKLLEFKMYPKQDVRDRIQLILESIEQFYQETDSFNSEEYAIGYILPLEPNEWWKDYLGDNWQTICTSHSSKIGNLTLVKKTNSLNDNCDLSKKQEVFSQSTLYLDSDICIEKEWRVKQIEKRTQQFADVLLDVWPSFGESKETQKKRHKVTGTTPTKLYIKNKIYFVTRWKDVLVETLIFLINEEKDRFESFVIDNKYYLGVNQDAFRSPEYLSLGYYVEKNLSARSIFDFCQKAMDFFGYYQNDWDVEYK